jgi:hypothetical protein
MTCALLFLIRKVKNCFSRLNPDFGGRFGSWEWGCSFDVNLRKERG